MEFSANLHFSRLPLPISLILNTPKCLLVGLTKLGCLLTGACMGKTLVDSLAQVEYENHFDMYWTLVLGRLCLRMLSFIYHFQVYATLITFCFFVIYWSISNSVTQIASLSKIVYFMRWVHS